MNKLPWEYLFNSFDAQNFHKGGPVLADKKKDEFASKRARTEEWFNERDRKADEAGYDYKTTPEDRPYSIMPRDAPTTPGWESDIESEES